ncbi:hypothetical protein KJ865_08220, partial [Myxococcota bacterium]|nr:hypothetical protein [Myxococcota bacterium]
FEPATFTFGDRVKANFAAYADQTFQSEDPITSDVPGKDVDFSDWPLGIAFQAASWHQKFSVFDDSVAYVGGMNVKAGDWDTQYHLVFDYRRMNFDATEAERVEVINKERDTDSVPRKDYFLRIHGPAAQDAADIFKTRWDYQLAQGADYAENSSAFTINRNIAPQPGGIPVQIAATMPEPFWEHAIAETWLNAFRQAQDYVFIDDQYFRIPLLLDALMEEMRQKPSLKLVVVILNIDEWTDGGCYWTYDAHNKLMAEFPDRYSLFKLATFDHVVTWGFDETESRYADIYTHDKMLIVDDIFLSVGSANKNNRGIIYEGEITATVLDSAWVKAQRRRIIANMVGPGYVATDDSSNWYNQMITSATWNDEVYTRWEDENGDIDNGDGSGPLPALYTPSGFLYSYHPGSTSDCFIEGIGPDLF